FFNRSVAQVAGMPATCATERLKNVIPPPAGRQRRFPKLCRHPRTLRSLERAHDGDSARESALNAPARTRRAHSRINVPALAISPIGYFLPRRPVMMAVAIICCISPPMMRRTRCRITL
ncbi:hypothetical protein, partial [Burkholderia pseudomallei]|uniref:hypothetical protein n=1 Tax=Burkholderia pseudomallei TaxID=28450 RepID=UPI0015E18512